MPFITIGTASQLQIKVPTRGSTNWDETMRTDTFLKIAEHDHTGTSGNGVQLTASAFADDAINGAKIRLDNNENLTARNQADSGDLNLLKADTNDELVFGITVGTMSVQDDGFTVLDNADNTKILAFDVSGVTTATTRTLTVPDASGTVTLNDATQTLSNKTITSAANTLTIDADVSTVSNIKNAEIKAGAAIAVNKLAALTANRAVASDASGFLTASSVTDTELGYVSGVTSAIQTQIDGKEGTLTNSAGLAAAISDETGTGVVVFNDTPSITGPEITTSVDLKNGAESRYYDSGDSNYVGWKAPALSANQIWTLPTGDGGASTFLQTDGAGNLTWASASGAALSYTTKTANYTATTGDDIIECDTNTTGAFTVTLYAASGNDGKKITIFKSTSDTNTLTIDGNSAETINGNTTLDLIAQYHSVTLVCDGSNWFIEHESQTNKDQVRVRDQNGHGSTNTKIARFATTVEDVGSAITYTDSSANGASFTIEEDGIYGCSLSLAGNATSSLGWSLNSTQLTTDIGGINSADVLAMTLNNTNDFTENMTWVGHLDEGDVLRAHCAGAGTGGRWLLTIVKIR